MSDDLHTRLQRLEERLQAIEDQQLVYRTAVGLARWFGPLFVSVAGILVVILK